MMNIILNILILSVAIFIVAKILPKIHIKSFGTAIIVAIVYSIINFLFGWLLNFIALPFIYLTFGLFKFVINAFLLWITDKIIDDFEIKGIGSLLLGALLITLLDSLIKWIIF